MAALLAAYPPDRKVVASDVPSGIVGAATLSVLFFQYSCRPFYYLV